MNNSFASGIASGLPTTIKAMIPPQALKSLGNSPQALVSPEAQSHLKTIVEGLGPQGLSIYEQFLEVLKQSLDSALSKVFFVAFLVLILAFITNLFIREIPLRKQHLPADSAQNAITRTDPVK